MADMNDQILKVLKEMSKKLDDSKLGGSSSGGSKMEEIKDTDSEKEKSRKLAANQAATKQAQLENAKIIERLRLEAEVNTVLGDRQAKMDALLELDREKARINQEIEEQALNPERVEMLNKELAKIDEVLDANQKLLESAKKQTVAQKNARQAGVNMFGSIAGAVGLTTKAQDTFLGKMMKTINVLKEPGGITAFFKGIAQGIFGLAFGFLDSVIKHTLDMVFALDEAQNKFSAVTQMGDKYNAMMSEAAHNNLDFAISAQETAAAAGGLYDGFFAFSQVSSAAQSQLVEFASKMTKLGVSAEQTAGIMNFFNKNIGQTAEQSAESAAQLALMGRNIGISASRMSRDFLAAAPKLAVYGQRATEIFGNIAAAAQRSGASINTLLGVADKFDTFSSAAETVGKLNSILGSQMSATEMLMMTEDERIETLILQVQASGMAFRDMDRFTQKSIAAAAGINDMNEAQRVFGMSLGSYREAQEEMSKEAAAQEAVDKAVKGSLTARNKLLIFFNKFVARLVTDGLIEKLHQFADIMLDFADNVNVDGIANDISRMFQFLKPDNIKKVWNEIKSSVYQFALLYGAIQALLTVGVPILKFFRTSKMLKHLDTIATGKNVAAQKLQGTLLPKNAAQMKMHSKAMKMNTAATNAGAKASAAAALKFAAIGAAIYMVVQSIIDLANTMNKMGSNVDAFQNVLGILAIALIGVSFALALIAIKGTLAAPALLAIGAAVLMMGLGIGIAAAGIGLMAAGFGLMGEQGLLLVGVLIGVGAAMYAMSTGMGIGSVSVLFFGKSSLIATPGIFGLTMAIIGISAAIAIVVLSISNMFKHMTKFAQAIKGTASDTRSLAGALGALGLAAIGGNLGIPFIKASTALAKAKKTTVNIGGLGNLIDDVGKAADDMDRLTGSGNVLSDIANGIAEIDTALGTGKKRVELVSTLQDASSLAASGAGRSVLAKQQSSAQMTQQAVKFEIQNEFKNLQLVVDGGTTLSGYIRGVVESNRGGSASPLSVNGSTG